MRKLVTTKEQKDDDVCSDVIDFANNCTVIFESLRVLTVVFGFSYYHPQ